jgi:hypothetical protein
MPAATENPPGSRAFSGRPVGWRPKPMTSLKAAFSLRFLAVALLTAGAMCGQSRAQSDSDLRKQNQELAAKVKDLQAELDAAKKQSDALQKRISQLESQLSAARSTGATGAAAWPPLEEEKVSIDESKPSASPRALFGAVVESYKKAVGDSPLGHPNDRDRVNYMRKLDKWKPATERELRTPIDWHVRLLEAKMIDAKRERIATFVAVDPVTDTRLGDPFDVALSRPLVEHLEELSTRGELGVLQMKGTAVINLRINPERETRGSFDNPRFVGPLAEFEMTVEPSSIVPAKPAASQPAATTTKPARPAAATTKPASP